MQGRGTLTWRLPAWTSPSSSTTPFLLGGRVTTPKQRRVLLREAVALQEMIVPVSTTCCFPEPWGQRPGHSTKAFRGEWSGAGLRWGGVGVSGSSTGVFSPSSFHKTLTPPAYQAGAPKRQGIRERPHAGHSGKGHSARLDNPVPRAHPPK